MEDKKKEETKEEKTTIIDDAKTAAERLEAANKETKELLKKAEDLEAKKILGGKSEAGEAPKKEEEISNKDYAKQALEGKFNDEKPKED